jgi:hypothetical protein
VTEERAEPLRTGSMGTRTKDFPFVRYREAVLMLTRLRKATKCAVCWEPIAVGAIAWRTLRENIRQGVCRSQRFCLRHFTGGQEYDDWECRLR